MSETSDEKPEDVPQQVYPKGYVELRRQLFNVDLATCPDCGSPMIVAKMMQPRAYNIGENRWKPNEEARLTWQNSQSPDAGS